MRLQKVYRPDVDCKTSTLNNDIQLGTPKSVAASVVTIHIKHPNQLAPKFAICAIGDLL